MEVRLYVKEGLGQPVPDVGSLPSGPAESEKQSRS